MHLRLYFTIAFLASMALAVFAPAGPAQARSCGPCPGVTTTFLNLRAEPNLDADVLAVMPPGAEVSYDTTTSPENGYYLVTWDGVTGYAHGLYLVLFPAFATTTTSLNLRSGPSLDSPVIQVMPPGGHVQVLSAAANGYFSVSFEQRVDGYAHGDYLDFDHTGGFAPGDSVVVRTDALNLRSGPGLNEPVQDLLYAGADLVIERGPVEGDGYSWYEVSRSAGTG